jgi:translation initiation factor 3 subunit E
MVQNLYEYSKFQFECGNYGGAADLLQQVSGITSDVDLNLNALWGKLAAEILTQNWEVAMNDLASLKDAIEQRPNSSHLFLLQQRTWFIHWSLFVFFNHPRGRDVIIDVLLQPNFVNTIQMSCPWILRYLATAVITNKKRRSVLKELVRIIQAESVIYRDPITEFVEALYVSYDFDLARVKLRECEDVLSNDFFLVATKDDFIENARLFIFETYCRIHQRIDIA